MLRNRQDIETDQLKGVMLAADAMKIEPGRFVRLENWIPGGVSSVRKKRGVIALVSTAITPPTPTASCA